MAVQVDDLQVRESTPADRPAIIELCQRSLNWRPHDPNEQFYAWKHDENPWGASPAWVAVAPNDQLVGLRTYLKWRFQARSEAFTAVRAVDTATDPAFQGQGIFSRLTLGSLPALADHGVDFIFNTPNDRSRPGYLKMGWQVCQQIPAVVRPRSIGRITRIARSRSSAELWSEPTTIGAPIDEVLDLPSTRALLAVNLGAVRSGAVGSGVARTALDEGHLRWRYGFRPLHYRAVAVSKNPEDGFVVVRVRRRAAAKELVIALALTPDDVPTTLLNRAIGRTIRAVDADHALATSSTILPAVHGRGAAWRTIPALLASGFFSVPKLGPVLTTRDLTEFGAHRAPPEMELSLGDIELF